MTNQPAAGTFSRLMATNAPMKEKQREEQEKVARPPVATVTSPIVETPQKGKKQRIAGKNPTNHRASKGNEISPTMYPSAMPKKREIKRRQPFDVFQDQVDLLKKLSLRDQMNGEIGSMSRMVREALDDYLKDKKL